MVGIFWIGAIGTAMITSLLASFILYIYLRGLRYGRSRISLGLAVFAAFIFAQSLIAVYNYFILAGSFGPEVGLPAMTISLTELLAIAFLFWATWQ